MRPGNSGIWAQKCDTGGESCFTWICNLTSQNPYGLLKSKAPRSFNQARITQYQGAKACTM